jgi:hypothetical protein
MPAMKNILSLASTLIIGSALALGACGKDKKPAANEPAPAAAAPAADPNKPADPNAPAAPAGDKAAEEKKGGW